MTTERTILVVDDDLVCCRMTEALLGRAGYRTEGTTDPVHALERVRRFPYALVVSDVQMPGMSGTSLAARIGMVRPGTAVLLVSGCADASTRAEAHALGAQLLRKPAPVEALLEVVAALTRVKPAGEVRP